MKERAPSLISDCKLEFASFIVQSVVEEDIEWGWDKDKEIKVPQGGSSDSENYFNTDEFPNEEESKACVSWVNHVKTIEQVYLFNFG